MEAVRRRDKTTRIVFPMVDRNGNFASGLAGLDSEFVQYADDSNPGSFADCYYEAIEIGTSGIYYLILRNDEVNTAYTDVLVKTTTPNMRPPRTSKRSSRVVWPFESSKR